MSEKEFCCEGFEKTLLLGCIRKFHGKWISDILGMREEDPSLFSDI